MEKDFDVFACAAKGDLLPVRDWLKAHPDSNYDLPQDVIDKTIAKYLEAYELLTGKKL